MLDFFILNSFDTAYECCNPRRRHGKTDAVGVAESPAPAGWQTIVATRD
jgi:hypothetical protein